MYSMVDLLDLIHCEGAETLQVRVGAPPVFIRQDTRQPVEDYKIGAADAEELLRSIANTRQMRELWERGAVEFIYLFRRSIPFLVRAWVEDERVGFDIN